MKNVKAFMGNFGLSMLAFFVINLSGILVTLLGSVAISQDSFSNSIPFWVEIILWLHILILIILCFYLGTKLRLLGNHIMNFLSVSGSIIFGLCVVFAAIYYNPYLILFGVYSVYAFVRLMILISIWTESIFIGVVVASSLPSIIIWSGMLYKSKKSLKTTAGEL